MAGFTLTPIFGQAVVVEQRFAKSRNVFSNETEHHFAFDDALDLIPQLRGNAKLDACPLAFVVYIAFFLGAEELNAPFCACDMPIIGIRASLSGVKQQVRKSQVESLGINHV